MVLGFIQATPSRVEGGRVACGEKVAPELDVLALLRESKESSEGDPPLTEGVLSLLVSLRSLDRFNSVFQFIKNACQNINSPQIFRRHFHIVGGPMFFGIP